MQTLTEIESWSKAKLVTELWKYIGQNNPNAEKELVEEIKLRRKLSTEVTLMLFGDNLEASYFVGRNDQILDELLKLMEIVCERSHIKLEELLSKTIDHIKSKDNVSP